MVLKSNWAETDIKELQNKQNAIIWLMNKFPAFRTIPAKNVSIFLHYPMLGTRSIILM